MTTHTTSSKKKPLTPEQIADAARLKNLWEAWQDRRESSGEKRMSQEAFGRMFAIGGQAAVWQYLNGTTALNLQAALAFARALGVEVSDFSPTLADRLGAATTAESSPFTYTSVPKLVVPGIREIRVADLFDKPTVVSVPNRRPWQLVAASIPVNLPETLRGNWGGKELKPIVGDEPPLTVDYLSEKVAIDVVYRIGNTAFKNVAGAMLKMVMEKHRIYESRLLAIVIIGDQKYTPPNEVKSASVLWDIPIKTAKTPLEVADIIVQMETEAAELFSQEPQD